MTFEEYDQSEQTGSLHQFSVVRNWDSIEESDAGCGNLVRRFVDV